MVKIDQCLEANRPLIFITTESDVELLSYIHASYQHNSWYVYSKTIAATIKLNDLMQNNFVCKDLQTETLNQVLDKILKTEISRGNKTFYKFLFLEADMYLSDRQVTRKVKDILSRYQLEPRFTINLLFVSQSICVPQELERLGEVVSFPLPDETQIKELSDKLSGQLGFTKNKKPDENLLNELKGLTLFEIEQAYLQSQAIYKEVRLEFIHEFKKNSVAKTDLLSMMETDISFQQVGGMGNLKQWLKMSYGGWTVEGQRFGLPLLKGVLLIGPTGTGKSLIMKALGNEWKLPVINFDPSLIFSSRLGDTEAKMHRVLNIVEGMAPCILAIDEIEKGFSGSQSSTFSDAGTTARTLGTFLIWMQECSKAVFTIATSNDIQLLPAELIGRFDEIFFVGLPQSFERRDIFEIKLSQFKRDPTKFDLSELAADSENFTGREIEQVLSESMYKAYHSSQQLTTAIIKAVLEKKTNILVTMAEQLDRLYKWVGWDDKKKDGVRARFASSVESLNIGKIKSEIDDLLRDIEKGGM